MGLCGITNEIKEDFGRRLRAARDARGLSRQVLSARLGVSPKTVQSWEMGRTFIEKLSLFPLIERELGISIAQIIEEAMLPETTNSKRASEPETVYGKEPQEDSAQPLVFNYSTIKTNPDFPEEIAGNFAAIPVIKGDSIGKEVHDLTESDVINHTVIARDWVPRGGLMIAIKATDKGLEPTIPENSLVIIDRRPVNPDKIAGKNVAILQKGKDLKLRQIEEGQSDDNLKAIPAGGKSRGSFEVKPDKGDVILGKIIAVFSSC